jgi:hypothetical protein
MTKSSSRAADAGEQSAASRPPEPVLDEFGAVLEAIIKHGETRRQDADATASALMTTAVALGAATIAAANALNDVQRIPEVLAWIVLAGLVGALLSGGAARAGILQRLNPRTGPLWARERCLIRNLRTLAEAVIHRVDDTGRDAAEAGDAKLDVMRIKETALDLSCAISEIHDLTVRFKNDLLIAGGISLTIALIALTTGAVWVLAVG